VEQAVIPVIASSYAMYHFWLRSNHVEPKSPAAASFTWISDPFFLNGYARGTPVVVIQWPGDNLIPWLEICYQRNFILLYPH